MRIIAFSAHTDDAEIGCGATLAKYVQAGAQIFLVVFSSAPANGNRHDPVKEVGRSAARLGIKGPYLRVYDFARRHLFARRQEILQIMCDLEARIKPDLVFCPALSDTHQDHEVMAREVFRAFKFTNILGYELPWNNVEFESRGFSEVSRPHLEKKIKALACYHSQKGKIYVDGDYILSWARMRGGAVGVKYAEAFEVIRLKLGLQGWRF